MAKLTSSRQKAVLRKYAANLKFLMMLLSIVIIIMTLPKQAKFRYEYEKGRIWSQKDLISPYNFAILKTNQELENDKLFALAGINPIYQVNDQIGKQEIENYTTNFEIKWRTAGLNDKEKAKYQKLGSDLLEKLYDSGLLALNKKYQRGSENYRITMLQNNVATDRSTNELYTIEKALSRSDEELSKYKNLNKSFLIGLVQDHLQVNLTYDEKLTNKIERELLEGLSLTKGMVQKGELILAKGSVINQDAYQKLESFKKAFEDNARVSGNRYLVLVGQFLLVSLMISLLIVFLFLFRKDIFADIRLVGLILLVITAMLMTLSLAIRIQLPSLYYIPYCIVPVIIRILFDTRLALNIHLLVVLIAGFFVPNSFEFVFFQLTAGMVAIYSIKNLVRREQFLISALLILGNYFIAFLGISFMREGNINVIEWADFVPFIFSVLLTLLAYPLIYAFEKLFGITSDISLIELTNTNTTLLRELAFNAPGTFQHSLQVANLAETAIYAIGGNSLLVRAGALYHDIGKMPNPQYFIENQSQGYNPHDNLPYEESARIIIQHVHNGIELARKHNLPEVLIDFIRTHHGNTRVDYFYQSFLKNFPEKLVDENTFRYPGPIPYSRETGVLMLADSVEAASRALREPDAQAINDLVDRIIDYKLDQDQLKNSDITLKDIETIRMIFKKMLISIYHVRIDYLK
ncbi:MAG: HD family phosphohydrolase [Sphingobacteriaceae bacterium]